MPNMLTGKTHSSEKIGFDTVDVDKVVEKPDGEDEDAPVFGANHFIGGSNDTSKGLDFDDANKSDSKEKVDTIRVAKDDD